MKKFFAIALAILVVFASGCVSNGLKFKECKLQHPKIREDQMTSLWINVENNENDAKNVQLVFVYPDDVTIERNGEKIKSFNITLEPNGATSGRKEFSVYGDYIEGQPSTPWDIVVQMYSDGELIKECKQTITIMPKTQ